LCLGDTSLSGEVVDLDDLGLAALGCEDHLEGTLAWNDAVLGTILVTESMTADDDGLFPAGYETGNTGNDNGCAEDGSSPVDPLSVPNEYLGERWGNLQVVADGAVGGQPHLLELELLYTLLVGGNGRALDTNRVLLDGLGGVNCDLVVGLITVLEAKIVVLEVNVEVWVNELEPVVSACHVVASPRFCRTLSLMTCQMILVISSPSSSTTGFTTLIFLIPVEDAILRCCPRYELKLVADTAAAAARLFAVARGEWDDWADLA
jgi:hypothetical protein